MVTRAIVSKRRQLQVLLRQIRIEAGLRQSDVAARLGHKQSYVSKYELGEHRLDLPQLDEVCEAIGIPLVEFARRYKEAVALEQGSETSNA